MGLKKAAAANRVTGAKSVNKTAKKGNADKSLIQGDTQGISDPNHNMMVSRSSSHGRLPSSQQPRQGSRQSKNRKSSGGPSLTHKETPPSKGRIVEAASYILSTNNGGPGSRV
jgi:hypothetical protein